MYMLVVLFLVVSLCCFFFFKQKTAYEMRISDWSSDVCSSDLQSKRQSANCGRKSARSPGRFQSSRRQAWSGANLRSAMKLMVAFSSPLGLSLSGAEIG